MKLKTGNEKQKTEYESASIEIILLKTEDVLTESLEDENSVPGINLPIDPFNSNEP